MRPTHGMARHASPLWLVVAYEVVQCNAVQYKHVVVITARKTSNSISINVTPTQASGYRARRKDDLVHNFFRLWNVSSQAGHTPSSGVVHTTLTSVFALLGSGSQAGDSRRAQPLQSRPTCIHSLRPTRTSFGRVRDAPVRIRNGRLDGVFPHLVWRQMEWLLQPLFLFIKSLHTPPANSLRRILHHSHHVRSVPTDSYTPAAPRPQIATKEPGPCLGRASQVVRCGLCSAYLSWSRLSLILVLSAGHTISRTKTLSIHK